MTDRAAQTPAAALRLLRAGNDRFAADIERLGRVDHRRRDELTAAQFPFATIFGCSDSRVPFEHIFDAGIGDVFVVRNAGQVIDDSVLGSIEFGVHVLGTPLLVILRHTRCGAVAAALAGGAPPSYIAGIVDAITPAVARVRATTAVEGERAALDPERVGAAHLEATVRLVLERSLVVSDAVATGALAIAMATYDLATGRVVVDAVIGDA